MKQITTILLIIALLTSCSLGNTHEENLAKKQECEELGYSTIMPTNNIICSSREKESPVMKCIKEYTEVIDEKYNNPDHVTNLREDDYSNVVKTCNDIFGTNTIGTKHK